MPNLPAFTDDTAGETQENKSYEDNIAALLASAHIETFVMMSVVRSDGWDGTFMSQVKARPYFTLRWMKMFIGSEDQHMRNAEDGNVNINSPPCCSIMG